MASSAEQDGDHHVLEMVACEEDSSPLVDGGGTVVSEEIAPLLTPAMRPKINIFSVSNTRKKPMESVAKLPDMDISQLTPLIQWVWSGSRYSGLLCMVLSSTIYFLMELISDTFSAQPVPLFEIALTRCTIILALSFLWLRRTGQPFFGPEHARKLLVLRAFMGYLSMFSFVYSIQRLPLSQATVLSFTTPIMASITARIALQEKLKVSDIAGLACSFFGVIFIFQETLTPQGGSSPSDANFKGSHHVIAILVGFLSSIAGGATYCLIKAGAKASDNPIVTVLAFSILATPAAGLSTLAFEEFVLPGVYTILLMLVLGTMAFLAEVLLARGLQLEKTSKVANVQYIEAALLQLWHIGSSSIAPSFGRLIGCVIVLISVCSTMYIGPETERDPE